MVKKVILTCLMVSCIDSYHVSYIKYNLLAYTVVAQIVLTKGKTLTAWKDEHLLFNLIPSRIGSRYDLKNN